MLIELFVAMYTILRVSSYRTRIFFSIVRIRGFPSTIKDVINLEADMASIKKN